MKLLRISLIAISLLLFSNISNAQKCWRNMYNFDSEENDEYDYEDASYYGYAEPGDTIEIKTVLLSRRKYKIYVQTAEGTNLQVSNWKVVARKKRTELTKKVRNVKYEYQYKINDAGKFIAEDGTELTDFGYKLDKYGEPVKDENGRPIDYRVVVNKAPVSADTVYAKKVITVNEDIYQGNADSKFYKKMLRGQSVIIQIVFAPASSDEEDDGGCYAVFIGNKKTYSKKATKSYF